MNDCNRCYKRPSKHAGIIKGKYWPELCSPCFADLVADQAPSSGLASYNRQRDLEDHLADIAQPYVGGKPSTDFIKLYPDKAKELFTPDEMRKYG